MAEKVIALWAWSGPVGRIDPVRVDATTEVDLDRQAAIDTMEAMQDTATFVRRVRPDPS